jgi:hypothetical protein
MSPGLPATPVSEVPMTADEEFGTDPDETQADQAVESMHNATEHLRRLWAGMNNSKGLTKEDESGAGAGPNAKQEPES